MWMMLLAGTYAAQAQPTFPENGVAIEVGKDANIVVSSGDLLDMRNSNVTAAYIQGRKIDLTDKHKLLNDRFEQKYELKAPRKGF
jgi:hypothetical protein